MGDPYPALQEMLPRFPRVGSSLLLLRTPYNVPFSFIDWMSPQIDSQWRLYNPLVSMDDGRASEFTSILLIGFSLMM